MSWGRGGVMERILKRLAKLEKKVKQLEENQENCFNFRRKKAIERVFENAKEEI